MSTTIRRDLFVYLSGPMTAAHGYSIDDNVAAGLRVFFDCVARGIPAFSPHLGGAFPSNISWAHWHQRTVPLSRDRARSRVRRDYRRAPSR